MEHPSLGMEPGDLGVVRDPDVDTHGGQVVERLALGRAGVGGGEEADTGATVDGSLELVDDEAHAVPANESNDEVDPVRRGDLFLQLVGELRLAAGVDQ